MMPRCRLGRFVPKLLHRALQTHKQHRNRKVELLIHSMESNLQLQVEGGSSSSVPPIHTAEAILSPGPEYGVYESFKEIVASSMNDTYLGNSGLPLFLHQKMIVNDLRMAIHVPNTFSLRIALGSSYQLLLSIEISISVFNHNSCVH